MSPTALYVVNIKDSRVLTQLTRTSQQETGENCGLGIWNGGGQRSQVQQGLTDTVDEVGINMSWFQLLFINGFAFQDCQSGCPDDDAVHTRRLI